MPNIPPKNIAKNNITAILGQPNNNPSMAVKLTSPNPNATSSIGSPLLFAIHFENKIPNK